jgi:hypothetical protein
MSLIALAVLAFVSFGASADSCIPAPTIQLGLRNCTFSTADDTDVHAWGVLLGVQGANQLCAVPSTVVNATILMASEVCDPQWLLPGTVPAQCRSRRGGFLKRSELTEAPEDIPRLNDSNSGWRKLMGIDRIAPFEHAARATLQLRDAQVTFVEGLVTQGEQHSSSHLGLASQSDLLASLKDSGLIGARSFGINAGSQSILHPRDGNLVLGGYDDSSIDGNLVPFSIATTNVIDNVLERPCPLQVSVSGLTITVQTNSSNAVSRDYSDQAKRFPACIEP